MKPYKIKNIGLLQLSIAIALLILPVTTFGANQNWESILTVKAGVAKNKLMFGQNADATDGMDGTFDVPALLSGSIEASFPSPIGNLWRDIKALGESKTWTINVKSSQANAEISIRLDTTRIPAGYNIYLRDKSTGSTVNLGQSGLYKYVNTGPRGFTINSRSSTSEEEEHSEKRSTKKAPGITTIEAFETTESSTKYRSPLTGTIILAPRGQNSNNFTPNNLGNKAPFQDVAKEYESYYKPSTKKQSEQIAGNLKVPSKIKGWIKEKKGLFIQWEDHSGGEHGFILEKKCGESKSWSLIAALWGVRPTYTNRKANIKEDGNCQYRIITFNHITESDYSDIITFTNLGAIEILEKEETTNAQSKKNE